MLENTWLVARKIPNYLMLHWKTDGNWKFIVSFFYNNFIQKQNKKFSYNTYVVSIFNFTDIPQSVLSLGSSLNGSNIKEGDDVYFECSIRANPKPYKISWRFNVSIYR